MGAGLGQAMGACGAALDRGMMVGRWGGADEHGCHARRRGSWGTWQIERTRRVQQLRHESRHDMARAAARWHAGAQVAEVDFAHIPLPNSLFLFLPHSVSRPYPHAQRAY